MAEGVLPTDSSRGVGGGGWCVCKQLSSDNGSNGVRTGGSSLGGQREDQWGRL